MAWVNLRSNLVSQVLFLYAENATKTNQLSTLQHPQAAALIFRNLRFAHARHRAFRWLDDLGYRGII
jgi:hypothetical protein